MEMSEVINTQLAFPGLVVGLVLICAVLVFVFGFKSVEDFPFDKLATVADDRKPAGKKRKVKDKKSQSNGQATVVSETTSAKVAPNKTKQVDKSPAKDVPKAQATTKQDKKQGGKTETAPIKVALKDTKNIKETNKVAEEIQKQGKAKDGTGKPQKEQQSNKQTKSKGKENVEVKNKKNKEKPKTKQEESNVDDEGKWESVSHKKSRKTVASDSENVADKAAVKTEATSPGKKKKAKPETEPTEKKEPSPAPAPVPAATVTPEPAKESKDKDKPAKKEKEQKKDKPKQVEEAPLVENVAVNVESEGEGKAAKKKKKKPAATENTEPAAAPIVEEKTVAEQPVTAKPSKPAEAKPVEEPQPANAPVFDELKDGDWEKTKGQKKASKKKVRKAE